MKKYYITAAIPYVNASPHLGHALEFVQSDVIARYHRLLGEKTLLLTGADENSLKNVQAAEKLGISTQKLCDENSKKFQELISALNLSFDVFQRSSSQTHIKGSQKLWQLCDKNGDIYKKKYKGLYCVGCETFYTKDELTPEGKCPEHLTVPQKVEEENYFFRLSKYQDKLLDLITTDKIKIIPETRKNEVVSFIKMGLSDFSISRSKERAKNWGVPVPSDPTQIIYVWFDALNVYQTGVGFGSDEKSYKLWWPTDVHVIGKGIIRFHAIYWPAILLSAHLPLPKSIFVHGYITTEGQKMSKTLGNIIDPFEVINKYGTDPLRYYLLREVPSYSDGDFSLLRFKGVYNADLANGLGNLISRVAKLCENSGFRLDPKDKKTERFKSIVQHSLEKFDFNKALEYIWRSDIKWGLKWLDQDINEAKPWQINDKKFLNLKLHLYVTNIREIAYNLQPFLPKTAEKILEQFSGPTIQSQPPLFPRLT